MLDQSFIWPKNEPTIVYDIGTDHVSASIQSLAGPKLLLREPANMHILKSGELLFGKEAKTQNYIDSSGAIRDFKLCLADPHPLLMVDGHAYCKDELLARTIENLHHKARKKFVYDEGKAIDRIVILHPDRAPQNYFTRYRQAQDRLPGLHIDFIAEAVGAALGVITQNPEIITVLKSKNKVVLVVVDYGHGTIDFSVLEITSLADGIAIACRSLGDGFRRKGGFLLDRALALMLFNTHRSQLEAAYGKNKVQNPHFSNLLTAKAEAIKIAFSDAVWERLQRSGELPPEYETVTFCENFLDQVFPFSLTRRAFTDCLAPCLEDNFLELQQALAAENISCGEVDYLALVGAQSNLYEVPLLMQRLLRDYPNCKLLTRETVDVANITLFGGLQYACGKISKSESPSTFHNFESITLHKLLIPANTQISEASFYWPLALRPKSLHNKLVYGKHIIKDPFPPGYPQVVFTGKFLSPTCLELCYFRDDVDYRNNIALQANVYDLARESDVTDDTHIRAHINGKVRGYLLNRENWSAERINRTFPPAAMASPYSFSVEFRDDHYLLVAGKGCDLFINGENFVCKKLAHGDRWSEKAEDDRVVFQYVASGYPQFLLDPEQVPVVKIDLRKEKRAFYHRSLDQMAHIEWIIHSTLQQRSLLLYALSQRVKQFPGGNILATAMNEAVDYGLYLGNKMEQSRELRVIFQYSRDCLEIEIRDQGLGGRRTIPQKSLNAIKAAFSEVDVIGCSTFLTKPLVRREHWGRIG